MNPPRNIPFGQMTTLECCQCLVAGKMPDGEIIDLETRKDSLSRIVPMIKQSLKVDEDTLSKDWIKAHPDEPFVKDMMEHATLIEKAEKIISS